MAKWFKVLAALLVAITAEQAASAGPWMQHKQCPPGQYCFLHILTPTAYRAYAYVQKTGSGPYGLDVVPRDPLGNQPVRFPCPGVSPAFYPYASLFPSAGIAPFPPDVSASETAAPQEMPAPGN